MYYSFIFPYLSYCIEVWGNASTCFTDTVLKLQKRAVRILISANYKAHTEPIFSEIKIMSLPKLFQYSIMLFMYKFTYKMLPSLFDSFFHYE